MGTMTTTRTLGDASSDLDFVGNQLRAVNADLKWMLQTIGQQPVGSVPLEVAQAVQNLNAEYNRYREVYEYVYRATWGTTPTGLGALGIVVPVALLALLAWLKSGLVIGGAVIAALTLALRGMDGWIATMNARRAEAQAVAIESVPPSQRGGAVGSIFGTGLPEAGLLDQLADVFKESGVWAAAAVLGLVILLRR